MDNRINVQKQVNCMKDGIVGFKYRHFKGGTYEVTDIAVHSETEEPMVIYHSCDHPDYAWCRPLSMFLSEVDHEKYPDVKQEMRFERIGDENRKIVEQSELKPCPFCGGKDLRTGNNGCLIGTDIYIKCTCGAKIQICKEFGKEELINRWNRRGENDNK